MTTSLEQPAISDKYDLRAPDLYRNPHALMGRMRAEDPVYWSQQLGSWVLTSYADVSAAMRDSRLSVVEETKRIRRLPERDQESLRPLEQIFGAWGGARSGTSTRASSSFSSVSSPLKRWRRCAPGFTPS